MLFLFLFSCSLIFSFFSSSIPMCVSGQHSLFLQQPAGYVLIMAASGNLVCSLTSFDFSCIKGFGLNWRTIFLKSFHSFFDYLTLMRRQNRVAIFLSWSNGKENTKVLRVIFSQVNFKMFEKMTFDQFSFFKFF